MELIIALNVVVANLRTHEHMWNAMPDVVAEAAADVFHEVGGAGVVDAASAGSGADAGWWQKELGAGKSDAGADVEAQLLRDMRLEERIDVGEKRTVGFAGERVVGFSVSPGSFYLKAEALVLAKADVVEADDGVNAASFSWLLKA